MGYKIASIETQKFKFTKLVTILSYYHPSHPRVTWVTRVSKMTWVTRVTWVSRVTRTTWVTRVTWATSVTRVTWLTTKTWVSRVPKVTRVRWVT